MWKALKKYKTPYLFILPFFILFIVFQLIPVIWTFVISFTEWKGLGSPKFVGLANYKLMMQDYMFKESFVNNVYYWVLSVILILIFSTTIAVVINNKTLKFGKNAFKSISFLPYVCASVAMGLIFGMLFDENSGLINEILVSLGGSRIPWLNASRYAKIPVLTLFVWRIVPWFTLIILSGLVNISNEYYEAATVDGANKVQQFLYITIPLLRNIFFFCFITITVDVWKMFNESYTLSGPGSSNSTIFQLLYQNAFTTFKLGYASAISVVLIIILLIMSLIQFKIRRRNGEI